MTATEPGFLPDAPAEPELRPGSALPGESALLQTWWDGLSEARRRPLLLLQAGDPLPRAVATELWRLGVSCPLTLVADGGRLVRRTLPPPALLELMTHRRSGEEA